MKKKMLVLALPLLLLHYVFAQSVDFNDYHILRSSGELPLNFSAMLEEDLANVANTSGTKRSKKDETDFIIQSTHSLSRWLRSGVVIYNDPVGDYLTRVLHHILEANGIQEDIKVYFIRSEEANAYAMDKNYIFFTAGLLAQVTSEAQIGMILAHEYIHYKNKHSRSEYIENKSVAWDYRHYKTSSTNVRLMMASYSRDLEQEADAQGFGLYAHTNYNYEAATEAFNVLRFSYLPFEEIVYEKNFLESNDLVFPKEYFLDEIKPVEYVVEEKEDEEDEKFRSHPHIGKRIVAIQELMDGKDNTGRKDFIVSENDFYTSRKIARYELCRLYLLETEYEKAFYSAYILLKEDPNSLYLQKTVLKSLYGLTKFSNAKKFSSVHISHKKKEGESQQVNYFMDKLSDQELNYTAIHYAWKVNEVYPEDADVQYILKDLVYDACKYNGLTPFSLKTERPDTGSVQPVVADTAKTTDTSSTNKSNKYSKIKTVTVGGTKKTGSKKDKANDFISYAFVDILKNAAFKNLVKEQYQKYQEDEDKEEERLADKAKKKSKKHDDEKVDETRNIEKLLMLTPVIMKIDARKDEDKIYSATRNKKAEMVNNLKILSSKLGIQTTVFNREEIKADDAELLNDIYILNTCMYETASLPEKINMLPTDNLDIKNLAAKYDTDYLSSIGVLTFVEKKRNVATTILLTVFSMGMLLPYTVYVLAQPNVTTYIYMNVYDVEKNKYVFSDIVEVHSRASQDVMGSMLYDMMLRMKKK